MSCDILESETVTVLTGIKKKKSKQIKTKQNALAILSFSPSVILSRTFYFTDKMVLYKKWNTKKHTIIYSEHNKNRNNPQCIPAKPVQGQIPLS